MTNATQDLDGECIHLLTRRFCALCNGVEDLQRRQRDLEVERVLALDDWFAAKYGGQCAIDNRHFHPGTPIRKVTKLDHAANPFGNWVAMCCAPQEDE